MSNLIFLKLGGSLITDKTGHESARTQILSRLAGEVAQAFEGQAGLKLLLGHGSGSFGHIPAAKYGTRQGVKTAEQWRGFAAVSATVARLNRMVTESLLSAGVPAISLQPSASAVCEDGRIDSLATAPIRAALDARLVPVIYGDVAFDNTRGGTIISTEEIMMFLAEELRPSWLLLAGETEGVYDARQQIVPIITQADFEKLQLALRGSRGTDVTGGMDSKVRGMLALVEAQPYLAVRIFSGMRPGELKSALLHPEAGSGTVIRS